MSNISNIKNNKIKELAVLALNSNQEIDLEKFAQLIVTKCAEAADMFPMNEKFVGDYVLESMDYSCSDRLHE